MTDEELAAIEARITGEWADPRWTAQADACALVAEVRHWRQAYKLRDMAASQFAQQLEVRASELMHEQAEVRRLRAEPSLQISLAEGQSYVTPTGWRMTMRDGTMVMDHEKVRVSYEYWNDAEHRWQAGVVENGPGR